MDPREFIEGLREAKASRDLNAIYALVREAADSGRGMKQTEQCAIFSEIKRLQGFLEHSDSRSWNRTGKVTKKKVVLACKRALEELSSEYRGRLDLSAFGKKRAAKIKGGRKKKVSR